MSGDQKAFEKAMNLGHSAAWDQSWSLAASYYRAALDEFPNHPMALTSLGLALFELQDFPEALRFYQKASGITPDDPVPVEKMARIFERQGRLNDAVQAGLRAAELHLKARSVEKAIENWTRVIGIQPEHLMARTRLAMVFERINRKPEAITEYLAIASLMQSSGDIAKALQVVEYCMQIMPENQDARQALSMVRANQRLPRPTRPHGGTGPIRMAEVRQMDTPKVEETKQQDPIAEARQAALVELAGLLFDQADEPEPSTSEQTPRINRIVRGTGTLSMGSAEHTRILMHLGQAINSQTQGDTNQAAEELERAVDIGLDHPAAYFDLGLLRIEKNSQRAIRHLQKAMRHPSYALASNLLLASAYEKESNYQEALPCYLHALQLADAQTVPESSALEMQQLYEPIIEEQSRVADVEKAHSLCTNIAKQLLRPDWRSYLQTARSQLSGQSEGGAPLPLAEMLLETNSSQVVEALANVRSLTNRKLYRSAMEEAYRAVEIAPTYLPLHSQIGEILLREGQTEAAVAKLLLVAELYNIRGETAQAISLTQRVSQMAPMDLTVRNRLIDMLIANGRVEDAIGQYMELASLYYHLTEMDKARQTYALALRVAQQQGLDRSYTVQILFKIADIDMQRLDMRQAVRIYEQIRTLEPEDATARAQLVALNLRMGQDAAALNEVDGFTALLEHSGKRAKAIEFMQGIIAEQNKRPEMVKRLAELYARNGQLKEAVQELDWLADWLLAAGNTQGAMTMLKTIISMRPPNVAEYQEALDLLVSGKQ